jgi:hypothetical protein
MAHYMMKIIELDGKMIWFLGKWFNIHSASKKGKKEVKKNVLKEKRSMNRVTFFSPITYRESLPACFGPEMLS